ncbi:hypothetical protein B0T16DRAFT_457385 [Cercophora newfieldiana]|uniref:LysM domain-containing protein n=1 Tax=Cercophora newfieldiana TaxID=92897 RepID=A0AA40CSV2_9PEZI|nr:hypothetical protein B0T16DRAFT_457385 [Cercophora newfieldiana]
MRRQDGPVDPSTAKDCTYWATAVDKTFTCEYIEGLANLSHDDFVSRAPSQYGISADDFLKWNPNVGSACGTLWLGQGSQRHGTCLSLLQAAPDTVASGVYQAVVFLCSPGGRETQEIALEATLDAYGGDRALAWKMAFREDRVPLISSINKETLRYFTFAPYATPRRTTKDIEYHGVVIPRGITMILNAQEANHD